MKRTFLIAVAAIFLGTTLSSCAKDLCPAYTKEHKANMKRQDRA